MNRALNIRLSVAAAIMFSGLPLLAQSSVATKVISDQILPKDTYFYMSVPSMVRLKEVLSDSSVGQLYNDPAMDAFKAEVSTAFRSELDEGLARVQEALGVTLAEFLEIPAGEISMAVSAVPGNAMGMVIFVDFGENGSRVQGLLDRATDGLANAPKLQQDTTSFDGTELTMFRVQFDGPAPSPLVKEFGWFTKDERLVISNREELLQFVLTNWDGGSERNFQQNEAYSYVLNRCQSGDRTALTTFFIDPIGLFTKLVQTGSLGQRASMGAGMALGFLPTLGLTQLKAIGAVSEAGSGDFEGVSRSIAYCEQPPMALMQVFQLDQVDPVPPQWVKDNVTAYMSINWKVQEAFQAIESLVDMFSGAGAFAERLNQLADRPPGIHLRHDIVEQLTGEIRFMTAPGTTNQFGGDQLLVALGVLNDTSADEVLGKIAGAAGMESRDFRNTRLYEVEGPQDGQSFGVCVTDGKLLLGMGTELLEQCIRNDADATPLAESDDFRRIAQHFPSNVLAVNFSRPAQQYRSIYELLRSGTAAEQFPGSDEIFEKVDFTTLPPFEVIEKYIHPAGGYSVADDNGVFTQGFQLKE